MKLNPKYLDPKKTAVIVVDLQNDFCHEISVLHRKRSRNKACALRVYKFIEEAGKAGVEVLFAQQIHDPKKLTWRQKKYYERVASGEREFGAYKGKLKIPCSMGTFGAEYFDYKPPKNRLFVKSGFDIWQNEQFKEFLDKHKIETLIITGVELTCCILYAVLGAEERGFNIVVPKDLVSGVDEGKRSQDNLLKIIGEMYAPVVNSEQILKIWSRKSGV